MLHFGYGSNMYKARIECRLGPCDWLGAASLTGFVLRFHKRGRDGSGKCDALRTGDPADRLHYSACVTSSSWSSTASRVLATTGQRSR